MRVEMDHRDAPLSHMLGHARGIGPRDRVIPAEHQRDRSRGRDGVHRLLQRAHRALGVTGVHLDVAGVAHGEVRQPVDAQGERRAAAVLRQVTGLSDVLRAEPRAGAVGGAAVERRAQDDDGRTGVGAGVGPVAAGHSEERDVGTERGAVPSHPVLPSRDLQPSARRSRAAAH